MTANEFIKSMREVFGSQIEYKATKGEQVFQSAGYVDRKYRIEVIPQITKKVSK
jgi:hypothetical protein